MFEITKITGPEKTDETAEAAEVDKTKVAEKVEGAEDAPVEKTAEEVVEEQADTLISLMQGINPYDYAPWMLTKEAKDLIKKARTKLAAEDFLGDDLTFPAATDNEASASEQLMEKFAADTLKKLKERAKRRTGASLSLKNVKKTS